MKFIFYLCRINFQYVEYEITQCRGVFDEYYLEIRNGFHERDHGALSGAETGCHDSRYVTEKIAGQGRDSLSSVRQLASVLPVSWQGGLF